MKKNQIIFFLFANLFVLNASAEKADSSFYVQVDLANRWIWRGVSYSEAPVIQPSFGYATDKMTFTVWGSYPIERRAYSEIDFMAEYEVLPSLKLGLVDYFAINDSIGAKHGFFDLNRETTRHMLDIYCVYQPVKKIPLSFLYSLWFWGADRDAEGKQNMSSFLEGKYERSIGQVTTSVFAGMTLWKGFYASKAAVVNLGVGISNPITLGEGISIPAKIEFVLNPELQNSYINLVLCLNG